MADWLDTVPWNKILGFSGDYTFAEGAYGHSVVARQKMARVLMEKLEEGVLRRDQAIHFASEAFEG